MVMNTRSITEDLHAADAAEAVVRSPRTGLRAHGPAAPALRTPGEIESIRAAGDVVRTALEAAAAACVPGAPTRDLEEAARSAIEDGGAEALFLHYPDYVRGQGFPAVCCVSVNDAIIHGLPGRQRLEDGDLVSIDCGARLDGWCADAAITVSAGEMKPTHRALVRATRENLERAIQLIRPGVRWSAIAMEMEERAARSGFGVVDDYVGHGIGRQLHESPSAPSVMTRSLGSRGDFTLRPGMVLAIEPMLVMPESSESTPTLGETRAHRVETRRDPDNWTVRTRSGAVSCHVEHTIAVTRSGSDVLTTGRGSSEALRQNEEVNG